MPATNRRKTFLIYLLILIGVILVFSPTQDTPALAQGGPAFVRQVRTFDPDSFDMPNVAGLAFSPKARAFLLLEARQPGQPPPPFSDFTVITPFADMVGPVRAAVAVAEPINMTFDGQANRLLLFHDAPKHLITIATTQMALWTLRRLPASTPRRLVCKMPRA